MGRKNQKQVKNKKSKSDSSDKNSVSKANKAENLVSQAVQGFQIIQDCDQILDVVSNKIVYCIDMQWFVDWQDYVGLMAIWDNEDPKDQQYFGKSKPKDQNGSLFRKSCQNFHKYPANMSESIYYNIFLVPNFSEDSVRVFDESAWKFFKTEYPDLVEIPRAQIVVEDKLQYAIELDNVWLGFFDEDIIQTYAKSEKKENYDNFDFYKIQIAKCLNFEMLEDLWVRFYLNRKYGNEEKRSQFKYKIWKLDQTLHIQNTINFLNAEMREETYRVKGSVFTQEQTKGKKVKHFTCNHYKFLLEVIEEDHNWVLKEHPMKKIGALCQKVDGVIKGICENCNEDTKLIVQCLCKQNYYCSKECLYKDKKFHSNLCDEAYDSDSDEELDKTIVESNFETGLANLGNTCYMNSGLQCLLATKKVQQFFKNNSYKDFLKKDEDEVNLTLKFAKLVKEVKSKRSKTIEPWAFKIQFGNYFYLFKGFSQHDAQEFVQNMLEIFNDQQIPSIANGEEDNEDNDESDGDNIIDNKENKNISVYDKGLSKEENEAIEFFTNIQKSMYSKLFTESFLGVFKSKLSCTGCNKSSVSFEQFSTIAIPIADKKKEVIANITYVPYDLKEDMQQVKFTLPIDSQITVQEIIKRVADSLHLPKENISRMMFALASNEYIKQEFFERNCTKKAIEMIKECSSTHNKFIVIYQLPHEQEFYTDENKVIGVNFKRMSKDSKDGSRIAFGIPRVIVINSEEIVADIYQQIAQLLQSIFPEGCDLIQTALEQDDHDGDNNHNHDKNILHQFKEQLKYEVLINSEKTARKKSPSICVFCSTVTCKSCPLPFLKDKQYQQYTQSYNRQLSFSLLFNDEQVANKLPQNAFTSVEQSNKDSNCPSLIDCLKLNQEKEILDEDNMWDCDVCKKKQIACKEVTIYYGPRYLAIQIKRFKTNQKGDKVKNGVQVNYAEVEDFTDYIYKLNPLIQSQQKKGDTPTHLLYRLYGVVIHSGQLDQGHYTSFTYQNEKWTYYNDDAIKLVDASEVINNKNAYLVFYELIE